MTPNKKAKTDVTPISSVVETSSDVFRKLKNAYNDADYPGDFSTFKVLHHPFKCCQLFKLLKEDNFVVDLRSHLMSSDFKMITKSNDLYHLKQSPDLRNVSSSTSLDKFMEVLRKQMKPFLEQLTGIPLTEDISVTCSNFDNGDFLLCHDDQLENRRVAFIYYLTPEDWDVRTDGGALELFNREQDGSPCTVVERLCPGRNSFSFFEVTPSSFHQVGEVTRASGNRLSINGWFNGFKSENSIFDWPLSVHGSKVVSPFYPPHDSSEEEFLSLITMSYIDGDVLTKISRHFSRSLKKHQHAHMALSDMFQDDSVQLLLEELNSMADNEKLFKPSGPPNVRRCSIFELSEESIISKSTELEKIVFLMTSDAFIVLLSQITGLSWLDVSNAEAAADVGWSGLEVRMWKAGDYSLLRDSDRALESGSIAVHYFIVNDSDKMAFEMPDSDENNPGSIVYVEKEKTEPVVTISPQNNHLAIVVPGSKLSPTKNTKKAFDESGLVHFTRYMNKTKLKNERFFEIYAVYGKK